MAIIDSIMSIHLWYVKSYQFSSQIYFMPFTAFMPIKSFNIIPLPHVVRSFNVKYTLDSNSLTHGIKRKHHNIHIDKTRSKHRGELACVNEVLHLKLA